MLLHVCNLFNAYCGVTQLSVFVFSPAGCKYTCHAQCRDQVALDCHQNGSINGSQLSALAQDHLNNNQSSHSVSTVYVSAFTFTCTFSLISCEMQKLNFY